MRARSDGAGGALKRAIVGLVAVIAAPLLFAGGGVDSDGGVPATLRIGTEGQYPPFNYLDESGELKGFDIDIALALCERLQVECALVTQDWDGIIPALLDHKYDAIVASMSITDDRRKVVSFTDRYYSNQARFLAAKRSKFDPAYRSGKTIGAQRATVAAGWLEENAGAAEIKLYDTQEEVFLDLTAGGLDAAFGDGLMLFEWVQNNGNGEYHLVGDGYSLDDGIGIAVRKEDNELRTALNTALAEIITDGTYAKINARYFPFSIR